MIRFTVSHDLSVIRQFAGAARDAEVFLANEVLKDTRRFVPFLTGSLANRAHVEGNHVVYPGPYARYLYYGKVMIDPAIRAAGFQLADGTWRSRRGAVKVVTGRDLTFNKSGNADAQSYWFEASKNRNMEKWMREVAAFVGRK